LQARVAALATGLSKREIADFAAACLDSEEAVGLPQVVRSWADYSPTVGPLPTEARGLFASVLMAHTWSPVTTATVLAAPAGPLRLKSLNHLLHGKASGGQAWEAVVLLAILLRRLSGRGHSLLPVCPVPAMETLCLTAPGGVESVEEVERWAQRYHADVAVGSVAVVAPLAAQFRNYDVVELQRSADGWRAIAGYQAKDGGVLPSGHVRSPGSAAPVGMPSVYLAGGQSSEPLASGNSSV
jgi:hypothetical protein